jgi:hypothetical protein
MHESSDLDCDIILDKKLLKNLMHERIDQLDIDNAIDEVSPFVKDKSNFEFWSRDYFKLLTDKIIVEDR